MEQNNPVNQAVSPQNLLDFLLRYTTLQMSVGVQTSRIVRTATRIAETYGYSLTIMIFQRNLSISIVAHKGFASEEQNLPLTAMTHHHPRPINFQLNSELTRLSWEISKHKPSIDYIEARFKEILALSSMNLWQTLGFIGCANTAFCVLFGGDLYAILLVFTATCLGFLTKEYLIKLKAYHYFSVMVAAFVSSFIIALGTNILEVTGTPFVALTASVLYLIPGVPFINSIMDFFDGFILNGLSRFLNALFIVTSLSIGLSLTLIIFNITLP